MTIRDCLAAGLLASTLAFGAAAVQAQDQPAAPAQQFDDSELESYAEASAELRTISQDWEARMAGAEDAQEMEQMQVQAETEMVEAVEAEGLTAERFNTITRAAQADQALAQRLMQMIEDVQGGG